MDAHREKAAADHPPSRAALRTAYEIILTNIWPRLAAPKPSTCRRTDNEDSVDTKRTDHTD